METKENILIVDDDLKTRKILSDILNAKGYAPTITATGKEALIRIEEKEFSVALIDLRLGDMSGLKVMKEIKECSPDTECILITGHASRESAIEAINLGVYSYLQKPYDMDQLLLTIQRAIEKQKAEEDLLKSGRMNEILLDSLPHPALLINPSRTVIAANRIALEIGTQIGGYCWQTFGRSLSIPEEHKRYIAEHDGVIPPGGTKCTFCLADESLKEQKSANAEVTIEGTIFDTWWVPIKEDMFLHYAIDITERKQAEEQVKASLKEKEVLLREIHHRVKNNMQVIISLLNLQADKIENKKYADMLKESQNRILSMAIVHEQLYQSKDFANIDFGEYVKSFVNGLFVSYGVDTNKVKLNVEIKDVLFDLENAIPCGLIINELVSNSLKHAFPQQGEGNISIILQSVNEDELELTVSDDGVGIPEDLDIEQTDTMGFLVVKVLTERQLSGKIELNRTQGTKFNVKIKKAVYKPRI